MMYRYLFLLGFMLCQFLYTQTSFERYWASGSRSSSLGDAVVSEAFDVSSMYWNPAALSFIEHHSIAANAMFENKYTRSYFSIAAPYSMGSKGTIGLGFAESYTGNPWYEPDYGSREVDIAYATRLFPTFSVGTSIHLQDGRISGHEARTAYGAIGIFYFPTPGISYGLAFRGIGSGPLFHSFYDPDVASFETHVPMSVDVGTTFSFPTEASRATSRFLFSCEKILTEKKILPRFGIEILPWKFLAARFGLTRFTSKTFVRYGIGIFLGPVRLDYTYASKDVSDKFHQASLSINVGRLL